MRRYFLILRLFLKAKFIFKNPSKHEIVIFDDVSIIDFDNFISHYNFFILQTRIEKINKIYFSFKILKYFFKHYNGNIMTAYLVSLLEIIHPKLVLTNIDNSLKFFDLARILDKKMSFVAIQGAARWDLKEYDYLYKKNIIKTDLTKNFYIPNFLCFGQYEIDHYKHYKAKVENFFKIGSLRLANFFHYINKNKIKVSKSNYDICLIFEAGPGFSDKKFEEGFVNVTKFTIKFCMKNNMKLICPQKRDKKTSLKSYNRDIDFFKKHLTNDEFNYLISNSLEKKRDSYTSYVSMLQSKVVVGTASTLLRENLAIGGKILSCNLSPTNIYDFPIEGICSIKNCTFQEFEKRLLEIYSISEKDYFSKLSRDKCYAVEYDENVSTIDIIKKKINSFLTENHKNSKSLNKN